MKSYEFLFWAYNVVWLGLAGYIGWLVLRLRGTNRRLERLERRMRDEAGRGRPT